jgi:RNA polymerase sigma-70 factor (ECF subfamily)
VAAAVGAAALAVDTPPPRAAEGTVPRPVEQLTHAELAECYRRFGTLVLRRCKSSLRGHADAGDVQQEVFVRLWRYGAHYREAESKVAFLYRITDRCCLDLLSRRGVLRETPLDDAAPEALAIEPAQRSLVEHRDVVRRFLSHFDERVKQVAVLRYVAGMTQEEIADAVGLSRQTIFQKLALLRRRAAALRGRLWRGGTS